jgi:hypothetical protein
MFIVDMMQKFELCYELPDRPHTYLIPDLLPKEAPETGNWDGALRFEFHYPVLPGSILTRLIVRMHRHVHTSSSYGRSPDRATDTRLAWRTGVVLACEGNEALVRADLNANRLTIAVRGPDGAGRRELLVRIREHLGAIHASIADLRPAAKVPVPGQPDIPPVDYAWLRKLERAGRTEFTPPGCIDPISVRQLLDGVESTAYRQGGSRPGLPPRLRHRLHDALARSSALTSADSLRGLFVDNRISVWRNDVRQANSPTARVNAVVADLLERYDSHGTPALALFVTVIADNTPAGDALYRELNQLANELRAALQRR